jgi:hypothetical protein
MDTQTILTFSHLPTSLWRWNGQSVPKCRHIKFRRRGITQNKTYNRDTCVIFLTKLLTELGMYGINLAFTLEILFHLGYFGLSLDICYSQFLTQAVASSSTFGCTVSSLDVWLSKRPLHGLKISGIVHPVLSISQKNVDLRWTASKSCKLA